MGWHESPPFFCTASDTEWDAIQELPNNNIQLLPQNFEPKTLPRNMVPPQPQELEMFSMVSSLELTSSRNIIFNTCCIACSMACILSPPTSEILQCRGGDSIAQKKLDKQNGWWDKLKEILSCTVDGTNYTIQLPDKILHHLRSRKRYHTRRLIK